MSILKLLLVIAVLIIVAGMCNYKEWGERRWMGLLDPKDSDSKKDKPEKDIDKKK